MNRAKVFDALLDLAGDFDAMPPDARRAWAVLLKFFGENMPRVVETPLVAPVAPRPPRPSPPAAPRKPELSAEDDARATGTLADQILDILPRLIKSQPKGPTCKGIESALDADASHVRRAMAQLDKEGRARMVRRKDSASWHLVPCDYVEPLPELTPTQRNVLEVLRESADAEGLIAISKRDIAKKAACAKGNIVSVMDALIAKGYLADVVRGTGTTPSTWRLIPQEGERDAG